MSESDLLSHLRSNPFVLAPMAGITDRPFRSFMREMGCGIVITELVSATGLKYSPAKTRRLMEFHSDQSPVGIQLFGDNLEHLREAACEVEQTGADFVDLNFGCPVPKVVNKGAGSACLKDLNRLRDTIRAVKSAVAIPVTIKIRTGWDHHSRNSTEVVKIAHDEGVTWVAIHGRTRAAAYTGLADWEYIRSVKAASPLPILGNGDVTSPQLAVRRLAESGCDGIMIGRGCLKNPRLFQQALAACRNESVISSECLSEIIFRLHSQLKSFYDDRLTLIQMRKFASWYSSGFPGAATFRREIFQTSDPEETLQHIRKFFMTLDHVAQSDTSQEPFLMGGHG
jgi:tRNA-dihydrouridine synthase B